jgi:hypothetical protein
MRGAAVTFSVGTKVFQGKLLAELAASTVSLRPLDRELTPSPQSCRRGDSIPAGSDRVKARAARFATRSSDLSPELLTDRNLIAWGIATAGVEMTNNERWPHQLWSVKN